MQINCCDQTKINFILNKIDSINESYNITHFEFINDSSNWNKIDDFCNINNVKANSINILIKDEPFLRKTFFLDFDKIQEIVLSQYVKENMINNEDIIDKGKMFGIYKEHELLELLLGISGVAYEYNIKDTYKFNFLVKFDEKENRMRLIIIKTIEKVKQNKIMLKIVESFKCKSGLLEINKKNLNDFFYNFFNDINKYNITNENIIENIGLVKDKTRVLLEKEYKNMDLIKTFKPAGIKSKDCNNFFDFEHIFIQCLISDIDDSFKDVDGFRIKEHADDIYIDFSNIESYKITINNSDLKIYCDDIKLLSWENFEESPNIKDKIEKFIRNDISRIFKRDNADESKMKVDILNILQNFFNNNKSLSIEVPPFYKQNIENISSKTIPVKIKLNEDVLVKNINEIIGKDLTKDKEFEAFREKIKIKSNTELTELIHDIKSKKRI